MEKWHLAPLLTCLAALSGIFHVNFLPRHQVPSDADDNHGLCDGHLVLSFLSQHGAL